jgi:predicted DCC family thiol-disulfide oxidoreductase YuxK
LIVSTSYEHPLILFDGRCTMCCRSVQFVLKRESAGRFRFATLDSKVAAERLREALGSKSLPDSTVVIDRKKIYFKSAAVLFIVRRLRLPWCLLSAFWLVPYPIRDFVYDWIGRNRNRWFARRSECWVAPSEWRARFLDVDVDVARHDDAP